MGGHVIKCGLAPILIDLMRRGCATGFVLNGAAAIHDFEIAIAGQTSEDVEAVLPDGRFGAAEETGREMNEADRGRGRRRASAKRWAGGWSASPIREFAPHSLLHEAYRAGVPVTVHVAVGTDTPHTHPAADGAAIGAATHRDFRLLCSLVQGPQRRRRLSERRLGRGAARSVPEGGVGGAQSGLSAGRISRP